MRAVIKAIGLSVCAAAVVACKNVAPDGDQAAVIVDSNDASRAALQQVVNNALNTEVALAADALTDTSLLIIERKVPRSLAGSPAQGRTMDMPIQFRLVSNGSDCILIDQRDESRHKLQDTSCVAE